MTSKQEGAARAPDTVLDDEHPLWYVNEVIVDMLDGFGASEDHEALVKFLAETGLPAGTVRLLHEAIAKHHQWGKGEHLNDALKALPEQVQYHAEHECTIEAARSNYTNDDLEIDDTPLLSPGEGGVWVSAWVWVKTDDDEEEEEDTDTPE